MKLQKFRWSRVYESAEEELIEVLAAQNTEAERWHAGAFHDFGEQCFESDTTLWCADGSMKLIVDGRRVSMQAGDTIQFPHGHVFSAVAGMYGVTCYESKTI